MCSWIHLKQLRWLINDVILYSTSLMVVVDGETMELAMASCNCIMLISLSLKTAWQPRSWCLPWLRQLPVISVHLIQLANFNKLTLRYVWPRTDLWPVLSDSLLMPCFYLKTHMHRLRQFRLHGRCIPRQPPPSTIWYNLIRHRTCIRRIRPQCFSPSLWIQTRLYIFRPWCLNYRSCHCRALR